MTIKVILQKMNDPPPIQTLMYGSLVLSSITLKVDIIEPITIKLSPFYHVAMPKKFLIV